MPAQPIGELEKVPVKQIQFSSFLGGKCLLLARHNMNAYRNTEEEVYDLLTNAYGDPDQFKICISNGCGCFYREFKEGNVPFFEKDPIQFAEFNNQYWAVEGKHRACLAKMAGIEEITAYVDHLDQDIYSFLPGAGAPGTYEAKYISTYSNDKYSRDGTTLFVWCNIPDYIMLHPPMPCRWLNSMADTEGKYVQIVPGLDYKVKVEHSFTKRLFSNQKTIRVSAEINIAPDHLKTKIWVAKFPAVSMSGYEMSQMLSQHIMGNTLYRYGCWYPSHIDYLKNAYLYGL